VAHEAEEARELQRAPLPVVAQRERRAGPQPPQPGGEEDLGASRQQSGMRQRCPPEAAEEAQQSAAVRRLLCLLHPPRSGARSAHGERLVEGLQQQPRHRPGNGGRRPRQQRLLLVGLVRAAGAVPRAPAAADQEQRAQPLRQAPPEAGRHADAARLSGPLGHEGAHTLASSQRRQRVHAAHWGAQQRCRRPEELLRRLAVRKLGRPRAVQQKRVGQEEQTRLSNLPGVRGRAAA